MSEPTLLLSSAYSFLAAFVYGYVGRRLGQRSVDRDVRLPMRAFGLWWGTLAALSFIGGVFTILAAFGITDLHLYVTSLFVLLLAVCLAIGCLVYYLMFLFTGKEWLWKPLSVFYVGVWTWIVYLVLASEPYALQVGRWRTEVQFRAEPSAAAGAVLLVLFIVPAVVGALGYLSLLFRVRERTLRYRIATVSLSFIVWLSSGVVAQALAITESDLWQVLSRVIGLAASFAILFAYYPPAFVQRWLQVRAVDTPTQAPM